jgi:hypothetical protein
MNTLANDPLASYSRRTEERLTSWLAGIFLLLVKKQNRDALLKSFEWLVVSVAVLTHHQLQWLSRSACERLPNLAQPSLPTLPHSASDRSKAGTKGGNIESMTKDSGRRRQAAESFSADREWIWQFLATNLFTTSLKPRFTLLSLFQFGNHQPAFQSFSPAVAVKKQDNGRVVVFASPKSNSPSGMQHPLRQKALKVRTFTKIL